jgi:hypothetical protein
MKRGSFIKALFAAPIGAKIIVSQDFKKVLEKEQIKVDDERSKVEVVDHVPGDKPKPRSSIVFMKEQNNPSGMIIVTGPRGGKRYIHGDREKLDKLLQEKFGYDSGTIEYD